MKIKYLGTAAYEGVPSMFCNCRVCKLARKAGGRNLRTRTQTLLDDDLLIDYPADTVTHFLKYGWEWEKIKGIIITHNHSDHLYPEDLGMARSEYSHEHLPVHIYAPEIAYKHIIDETCGYVETDDLKPHLIAVSKRFKVGNYDILPLWANHDQKATPVIYSIKKNNKQLLYAHDTGVFCEQTLEALKNEGRYDLISLDCTGCLGFGWDWRRDHMSLKTNLEMVTKLKDMGAMDDNTKIVLNHFSHNGGQTYDEMLEEADKYGFIVSYDGLEVEF